MKEANALDRLTHGLAPTGVDLSAWRSSFVLRRLRRGALLSGDVFLDRHVDRLLADRASLQRFLDDLSIGVSAFFRDALAFAQLETLVLPELARHTDSPRALSLGCAQGQEAWSVAILLSERFAGFELLAIDRRTTFLDRARAGVYQAADLERVQLGRIDRCFQRAGAGYEVKSALRHNVRFDKHDLAEGTLPEGLSPASVDLVLCRNVFIYLSASARERLFAAIAGAITPHGKLMLGEADGEPPREFFAALPGATTLYRRIA